MDKVTDTSFLIDPENPTSVVVKKKVRFSETVTVYRDGNPLNTDETTGTILSPEPYFVPLHEIVERNKFSMRTQMEQPIQCSLSAILILFFFLLFFTFVVWFVIQKLLLIEIESQTQTTSVSQPLFS